MARPCTEAPARLDGWHDLKKATTRLAPTEEVIVPWKVGGMLCPRHRLMHNQVATETAPLESEKRFASCHF